MLARYSIQRGRKIIDYPKRVQEATRQDTRKHTRHVLRPDAEIVREYLADPTDNAWLRFEKSYLGELAKRFANDRSAMDELATMASAGDLYLGCSCPTAKNPDLQRCHTVLALRFMAQQYPFLDVSFPDFR
ncbi:hypothetical protein MK489_21820 [Myxococcota bacterium]|nr:hypothetical protein [Myxococcota bacterium]